MSSFASYDNIKTSRILHWKWDAHEDGCLSDGQGKGYHSSCAGGQKVLGGWRYWATALRRGGSSCRISVPHNRQLCLAGQSIINILQKSFLASSWLGLLRCPTRCIAALIECIEAPQYPAQVTNEYNPVPLIERPPRLQEEGVISLDNRAGTLRCFEAFKQLLDLGKTQTTMYYVDCGARSICVRGSSVIMASTNLCNYFSRCRCLIFSLFLDRPLKVIPNFYRSNDCFSQNVYDVPQ